MNDFQSHFREQGDALFYESRYDEAGLMYHEHLQTFPHDVDATVQLGFCFLYLRDPKSARTVAERAVAMDHQNAKARFLMSQSTLEDPSLREPIQTVWDEPLSNPPAGRFAEAETNLRRAIELDRKNATLYAYLADLGTPMESPGSRQRYLRDGSEPGSKQHSLPYRLHPNLVAI